MSAARVFCFLVSVQVWIIDPIPSLMCSDPKYVLRGLRLTSTIMYWAPQTELLVANMRSPESDECAVVTVCVILFASWNTWALTGEPCYSFHWFWDPPFSGLPRLCLPSNLSPRNFVPPVLGDPSSIHCSLLRLAGKGFIREAIHQRLDSGAFSLRRRNACDFMVTKLQFC